MTEFKKYKHKESGEVMEAKYLGFIREFFIPEPLKKCPEKSKYGCQYRNKERKCLNMCENYLGKSIFKRQYEPIN